MHIYLNLVKINCFLDVYPYHLIKFQSLNAPSCQHFWTGLLFMYIVHYNIQYYFLFLLKNVPIVFYRRLSIKSSLFYKMTQDFNNFLKDVFHAFRQNTGQFS